MGCKKGASRFKGSVSEEGREGFSLRVCKNCRKGVSSMCGNVAGGGGVQGYLGVGWGVITGGNRRMLGGARNFP